MSDQNQPIGGRSIFSLRTATADDLDDITNIHIAGFTEEPEVHYRYPFRGKYPYDHCKWTRKEYEYYLEQPQKFRVHVLDAAIDFDGKVLWTPVALAVWIMDVKLKSNFTDPGLNERRDANRQHCNTFRDISGKRFNTYFAKYDEEQVYLSVLVVHPDHRRRGAGTMLVNWGIKIAEERKWPVTLCASPMGKLLYDQLGFKVIGKEVVRVESEEEIVESSVMVNKLSGKPEPDRNPSQQAVMGILC